MSSRSTKESIRDIGITTSEEDIFKDAPLQIQNLLGDEIQKVYAMRTRICRELLSRVNAIERTVRSLT